MSASLVKKSRPHFVKSADLRGASKIVSKGSLRDKLISGSARSKIKGLRFQSKAKIILSLGAATASAFAHSAATDAFEDGSRQERVVSFVSAAVPFLSAFSFRRIGKVRFGGSTPAKAFKNIQKFGQEQTRRTVRTFESTKFKKGRTRRGKQLEMDFGQKKNSISRFLKGF